MFIFSCALNFVPLRIFFLHEKLWCMGSLPNKGLAMRWHSVFFSSETRWDSGRCTWIRQDGNHNRPHWQQPRCASACHSCGPSTLLLSCVCYARSLPENSPLPCNDKAYKFCISWGSLNASLQLCLKVSCWEALRGCLPNISLPIRCSAEVVIMAAEVLVPSNLLDQWVGAFWLKVIVTRIWCVKKAAVGYSVIWFHTIMENRGDSEIYPTSFGFSSMQEWNERWCYSQGRLTRLATS